MPELMTETTDEAEARTLPIDEPEPDHVEVPEDEIGENGRRDYEDIEDALDDGGEIELDEATLLDKSRQLDEIRIANVEVKKARDAYESAKRVATSRKADWEESVERLSSLIDVGDEDMPLFDRKPGAAPVSVESDMNGAEGVRLATVKGFPEGVARALEEQVDITTVGQLATFSKTKDLTLLKGVGPAKADAASDAMAAFWVDWSSKYPPKGTDAGTAG